MSTIVTGVVRNGVVVLNSYLPENAQVDVFLSAGTPEKTTATTTPAELRELPREQRQAILATAALLAEEDYRTDKDLTGFDAFSEEELDDDAADPGSW